MRSLAQSRGVLGATFALLLALMCGAAFAQQEPAKANAPDQNSAQTSNDKEKHTAPPPGATEAEQNPVNETNRELAHASEEAAGEHEENAELKRSASVRWVASVTGLDPHVAYWILIILNFGIVAGLFYAISKSTLPAMFRGRTVAIQKSLEEARRASAEANQRLAAIEARLAKIDAEVSEMRASAENDAAAEEERLRGLAEQDKQKVVEAAEAEIAAATNLARHELKAFTAELAVTLAEKKIRLEASEDKALVRTFVRQLKDGQ